MLWRGSSLGQTTNYANTPCVLNKNLECPENGWTNSTFRRKIQVMRAHAVRSGCVGERTGVEERRARNGPWGRGPVSCDIVVAAGPGPARCALLFSLAHGLQRCQEFSRATPSPKRGLSFDGFAVTWACNAAVLFRKGERS